MLHSISRREDDQEIKIGQLIKHSLPKSCDIFADEPYKTKIYMKINKQNHEQVKIQLNRLKEVRLCLILATFKEQVDKLNLVELGN